MAAPSFRVKAVFDYSSPHDDDLSFPNGQIIVVTDEEDESWYYGEYTDDGGTKHQGLFPRNFVERYEPTTPPRPSRAPRPKKEAEAAAVTKPEPVLAAQEQQDEADTQPAAGAPLPSNEKADEITPPREEEAPPTALKGKSPESFPPASISKQGNKPSVPVVPKPAPQSPEGPSGGSFRDRIAAFNKAAAPPVAPIKPGGLGPGGSSFVKKPFVPPPPSRNAYVPPPREPPPQKIYRREENPSIAGQPFQDTEVPSRAAEGEAEDQPKPTSLKERIALLQKQQLEQASKHTEAAQKKEKPKRPPKKRLESFASATGAGDQADGEILEKVQSADGAKVQNTDTTDDEPLIGARNASHRAKSMERTPLASPSSTQRDFLSDPNDADQSGAGETEDGGDLSTGREDNDEKPVPRMTSSFYRPPLPPARQQSLRDQEDETGATEEKEEAEGGEEEEEEEGEGDEEEEEDDVDPEVKRRMEIRERMAKMSGGMGMAGMFGPPGGLPPMAARKPKPSSGTNKPHTAEESRASTDSVSSPHQPLMALPGMSFPSIRVKNPEESHGVSRQLGEPSAATEQDDEEASESELEMEAPEQEAVPKLHKFEGRGIPPPVPQDRPIPTPPHSAVITRAAPPPPDEARPVPEPPSNMLMSPSEGSESDGELSTYTNSLSLDTKVPPETSARSPPPIPTSGPPQTLPPRPQVPQHPESHHQGNFSPISSPKSPTSPEHTSALTKRTSRMPPIPSTPAPPVPQPQSRAPPPPPPGQAVPARKTTEDFKPWAGVAELAAEDSDEEVTEYDGDYDTDMAPGATHKDALKSSVHGPVADENLTGDEAAYHHEGLPSIGPPPPIPTSSAPRGIPPPPPNQPPRNARQSSDMPRAAPPPPPPPKAESQTPYDAEYDPFNYTAPQRRIAVQNEQEVSAPPQVSRQESDEDIYNASPPHSLKQHQQLPSGQVPQYMGPPVRQSLDVLRNSNPRRSMDTSRPSIDQGYIANDVALGRGSQWWLQRKMPPPVFQSRSDIAFEIEEQPVKHQSGTATIKHVYALFMDYSQTVITAQFDPKDPSKVELEQRHEPPPARLRPDQLENAQSKFNSRISEMTSSKLNTVVGDGTPFALIADLLSALPEALPSVGTRAYGSLVYANLANASVQQHDEIRPGDIISFRNAKMQGHRGPMKAKYNIEIGKPDHVAVVVDWDGTKKKVRAWEQGRESRKVKMESFKLGDLRSGEVKVWRVMPREWVGWGGGHS